ncbi:MAG: Uma2 family endonuclease [Richelia sp. CSU_2_1]|nr:Uma2 family endonuclease [Richelia sp. CSU_2_1]
MKLNYWVSGRIMVRTLTSNGKEQGRHPDVTVVDKTLWESKPFDYSALTEPPQLVVEVVSTNWEDDYIDKLDEYQRLGIPEYWIVDYLALGSRNYLGNPKEPTVFVYLLDENGVYQMTPYRGCDRIISRTFPELVLIAEYVLDVRY